MVEIKFQKRAFISPSQLPERSFHRALRSVASDAEASPAWHCAAAETPYPPGPGSAGSAPDIPMEGMVMHPVGIPTTSLWNLGLYMDQLIWASLGI